MLPMIEDITFLVGSHFVHPNFKLLRILCLTRNLTN